jgi:hypothetical protein
MAVVHHHDAMPPIEHGAIGVAQAATVVVLHTGAIFATQGSRSPPDTCPALPWLKGLSR